MAAVRFFASSFAGCCFTGVNYRFRPWHQLFQVVVFVLWQLFKNIDKGFEWIQPVRFCGLDQAKYHRCRFCSGWCFTKLLEITKGLCSFLRHCCCFLQPFWRESSKVFWRILHLQKWRKLQELAGTNRQPHWPLRFLVSFTALYGDLTDCLCPVSHTLL